MYWTPCSFRLFASKSAPLISLMFPPVGRARCRQTRVTLRGAQLGINLGLVGRQRLRQRFEAGCQCRAFVLPGQRLRPIQRQVEMAATIIQFANSPRRRTVVLKDLAVGLIERLGQNLDVLIPTCLRKMFQRSAKRQELAK